MTDRWLAVALFGAAACRAIDPVALPIPGGPIDYAALHADLLPRWVVEPAAAEPLVRAALAEEPGLSSVFDDLVALSAAPAENAAGLFVAVDQWNARLDRLGAPWRIDGGVVLGEPSAFYLKCYRVVSDVEATVGARSTRIRLVERVDHLNVIERYLGASRRGNSAVVVVDRVAEFAEDVVWPALADRSDRGAGEAA